MRTAAVVVVLAAIWVLLWGSASVANIVTGVLIGTALVMLVPGLRGTKQPLVIRPIAIARLLGHFLVDLIRSNVVLTREILARRSRIHTAIVGVELPGCSDELLTAITNLLALAPGTMPVEMSVDPVVLYVHVLHLEDVEEVRREVRRLTDLAYAAFAPAERSPS